MVGGHASTTGRAGRPRRSANRDEQRHQKQRQEQADDEDERPDVARSCRLHRKNPPTTMLPGRSRTARSTKCSCDPVVWKARIHRVVARFRRRERRDGYAAPCQVRKKINATAPTRTSVSRPAPMRSLSLGSIAAGPPSVEGAGCPVQNRDQRNASERLARG